jgi:hypothetical protein
MKSLIYLSLSFIFLLFFNSCTSSTGGDSIVIEQMDFSEDISLKEFNERRDTRYLQYEKVLEFKNKDFSGYSNLIKKETDDYKKAKILKLADILPDNLEGITRKNIEECAHYHYAYEMGIEKCYGDRVLVYQGETSYCKDTCKNCCLHIPNYFRKSPSFRVYVQETNLSNANIDMKLLKDMMLVGRIEAFKPQKDVLIQEVTLDLPNNIEVGEKLYKLMNKDEFGNHVTWDFPPRYYGLIIQINYRVYIVAEVYSKANYSTEPRTYPEFKDPKEFDATVKAVKALKDNLDYSKIIELTTPQ